MTVSSMLPAYINTQSKRLERLRKPVEVAADVDDRLALQRRGLALVGVPETNPPTRETDRGRVSRETLKPFGFGGVVHQHDGLRNVACLNAGDKFFHEPVNEP